MQSHHAPIRLLAVLILLAAGLAACDTTGSRLRAIDGIIEDDPARALAELQLMPTAGRSHADSAYYALLYTQAQIKNYINVDSDSLISIAYDAYKFSGNRDLRRRTHFYQAQVAYYRGDYRNAMQDAIVAYDIAKEEDNPYWIAKAAELMADIFFYSYNHEQAELFSSEAADNYLKANKILNHRYALCALASNFLNNHKPKAAILILDSLQAIVRTEKPLDTTLDDFITSIRCSDMLDNQHYDLLKKSLPENIDSINDNLTKIDVSIFKSYVLTNDGDSNSADRLLAEAYALTDDDKERIRIMYASYLIYKQTAHPWQALELADSMLYLQSSIGEQMLKESVTGVQRDFYSTKAVAQQHKSTLMGRMLLWVALTALIIILLLIIIYRLRIRTKNAELEANLSSLMRLQQQSDKLTAENKRISSEITDTSTALFRDKWTTLNMLCGEYLTIDEPGHRREDVLNKLEREIKKLRTPQSLHEIEAAVDNYMGSIMTMLRYECPILSEDDYTFLSLIYAGFSSRAVCVLIGIKYKLFYLKKSRLTKRILASDAPHRQLFVDKMS